MTDIDQEIRGFTRRWRRDRELGDNGRGDLSGDGDPSAPRTLDQLRRQLAGVERQMMTPAERRKADVAAIQRDRDLGLSWIRLEEGRAMAGVTNPDARRELERVYADQRANLQQECTRREAEAARMERTVSTSRAVGTRTLAIGSEDNRRGDTGAGLLRREMARRQQDLEITRDVELAASPDNADRIHERHRDRLRDLDAWGRNYGEAWAVDQVQKAQAERDADRARSLAQQKAGLVAEIARAEAAEKAAQNGHGQTT